MNQSQEIGEREGSNIAAEHERTISRQSCSGFPSALEQCHSASPGDDAKLRAVIESEHGTRIRRDCQSFSSRWALDYRHLGPPQRMRRDR